MTQNTISCSWACRSAAALLGSDGVSWAWIQSVPCAQVYSLLLLIPGLVAQLGLFLMASDKATSSKRNYSSVFSASAGIKFLNIPLPEANHMGQPKVSRVRMDILPTPLVGPVELHAEDLSIILFWGGGR